jgi:phospholipid/cholesterol/gamma-HCH transport system substrate-binding protein
MKKDTANNVRLGLFITIGTAALVVALYLIGSNRNIFGNTIRIHAHFFNVNGLMAGNNVRYAGIDIGTVDKVAIENDSSVTVYMIIEKKQSEYIKKNSVAAIGTDGLMGNKLVNINPGIGEAPPVESGDEIQALKPIETDEMVRTLNTTNENLEVITGDLRKFTSRINKDKGVLKLIEDSITTENIKAAMLAIREAAENANRITLQLNRLAEGLNRGDGLAGVLLKDTTSAGELRSTIHNLQMASDSINMVASDLSQFSQKLNNPDGLVSALTTDTALTENVRSGLKNLEESTVLLNENLKAMRRSFLFKKYFKEQEKRK